MREVKATPRCGNNYGVKASMDSGTQQVYHGWTHAKCRAITFALGGGFLVLAALEAVAGW
jgi:hypothetical protein